MNIHLTCMTALNQQVFPTFFKPTGHPSCRCRSYGFTGSTNLTQGSPLFLFSPDLFSAKLASKTLKQTKTGLDVCIFLIFADVIAAILYDLNKRSPKSFFCKCHLTWPPCLCRMNLLELITNLQ